MRNKQTVSAQARHRSVALPALTLALALFGLTGCSGLSSQGVNAPLPGDVPAPTADAATRTSFTPLRRFNDSTVHVTEG